MTSGGDITYNQFEKIFIEQIDKHAPMKEKYVRANNTPFMNNILSKAIMNRSRLQNRFIKNPNATNQYNYKRQRNYVVNLLRREKKKYYDNIDPRKISDNQKFWKAVKPLFSDKNRKTEKITLIESGDIISNDNNIAEIMNNFFTNIVANLDIAGYNCDYSGDKHYDQISSIADKFKNHPSILNIKERIHIHENISRTN